MESPDDAGRAVFEGSKYDAETGLERVDGGVIASPTWKFSFPSGSSMREWRLGLPDGRRAEVFAGLTFNGILKEATLLAPLGRTIDTGTTGMLGREEAKNDGSGSVPTPSSSSKASTFNSAAEGMSTIFESRLLFLVIAA